MGSGVGGRGEGRGGRGEGRGGAWGGVGVWRAVGGPWGPWGAVGGRVEGRGGVGGPSGSWGAAWKGGPRLPAPSPGGGERGRRRPCRGRGPGGNNARPVPGAERLPAVTAAWPGRPAYRTSPAPAAPGDRARGARSPARPRTRLQPGPAHQPRPVPLRSGSRGSQEGASLRLHRPREAAGGGGAWGGRGGLAGGGGTGWGGLQGEARPQGPPAVLPALRPQSPPTPGCGQPIRKPHGYI